jgi:hypothetical protein
MADLVCAQNVFRRKGTRPILQVTVYAMYFVGAVLTPRVTSRGYRGCARAKSSRPPKCMSPLQSITKLKGLVILAIWLL